MQVPSTGHRKKPVPQEWGAETQEKRAYAGTHLPHIQTAVLEETLCQPLLHTVKGN